MHRVLRVRAMLIALILPTGSLLNVGRAATMVSEEGEPMT
jgi:hypothetical protein